MIELRLLPKRRISWFLWVGLLMVFLPKYYSSYPFPGLIYHYENEMWTQPCTVSVGSKWDAIVRAPRTLADFTDMPMIISVINRQASPDNALIAVTVACSSPADCEDSVKFRVKNGELEQNTVSLAEIPPNGAMTTQFRLRVVPERTEQVAGGLVINVSLNGEDILQKCEEFRPKFDREQVFRLWAIENLLSPPGSNVVVPIFFLFLVVLAEMVADVTVYFRQPEKRSEFEEMYQPKILEKGSRGVWVRRVIIAVVVLAFVLLLRAMVFSAPTWGPLFSDHALNVDLRRRALCFIGGAIVAGIMAGFVASTNQNRRERTD